MKKYLAMYFVLALCLLTCASCFKGKDSKGYNTKNSFNVKLIKATHNYSFSYGISLIFKYVKGRC